MEFPKVAHGSINAAACISCISPLPPKNTTRSHLSTLQEFVRRGEFHSLEIVLQLLTAVVSLYFLVSAIFCICVNLTLIP